MSCRFKQFGLRTLFFATTAAAVALVWFSPYSYSITEYWPDGTLRSRCTVRNGLNGEILAYGPQIFWNANSQDQYEVEVWDVPYKSATWRMQIDLGGIDDVNIPWRRPTFDHSGFQYMEGSGCNRVAACQQRLFAEPPKTADARALKRSAF